MRTLVTGGAGFIGSHLCDRLIEAGHAVAVVDDMSLGRESNVAHLLDHSAFALHRTSILAPDFDAIVAEGRFDRVFHMAANSDIQAGSRDRSVDLDRTFLTTWHVCESMARHAVRELVYASTSAVYGEVDELIAEDHGPLLPISYYGAAKLAGEAFCSAYAAREAIRTWVFRFPNVVGSRATHGVILDFIERLQRDPEALEVLGDGTQEKPYLYVHDLLDAILLVVDAVRPAPHEVFNVGPETATRVRRIAETVVEVMGLSGKTEIRYGDEPRGWPGDVSRFAYDLRKIHALGWSTGASSDDAMRRAVEDIWRERTRP